MTEQSNTVIVVKPPLKTIGRWVAMIVVVSMFILPIGWCYGVSAAQEGRWGWAVWVAAIWLGGIALLASLSLGFYGARADDTGLTLEKAWQPSSQITFLWEQVRALEIEIKPEQRNRMRYLARVSVRRENENEEVECPYDPALCKAIVARANLELKKAPGGWLSAAAGTEDPFVAIRGLGRTEQTWSWLRS